MKCVYCSIIKMLIECLCDSLNFLNVIWCLPHIMYPRFHAIDGQ
jgi:hypothetical protein